MANPTYIGSIDWEIMSNGRGSEPLWFHPRACSLPADHDGANPVFMTAQQISGSDYFHPVHWMMSGDLGASWSAPQPVPGFGRHDLPDTDIQEGVCDVVPEYHLKTRRVLCIGHSVYYRDGKFFLPQPDRCPMFASFDPATGSFSDARAVEWDRSSELSIYSSGCAQRHTTEAGDILLPLSFRRKGEEAARVTTARVGFDGSRCVVEETGTELELAVNRGLLEPSVTEWNGRFFLTIRAEDGHGYRAISDDGLTWRDFGPWCWDDGTPLEMSTTQSRWLPHSDALYLVYVRKDPSNVEVMRWRAPLFVARVDPDTGRLIKETEQIAVPLRGDGVNDADHVARLGNFHTVAVSPTESWVTVGECIPKDDWKGDTIISRIGWTTPNRRFG